MPLTVKAMLIVPKNGTDPYKVMIRNKGNTIWNEKELTSGLSMLLGTRDTAFFRAHLEQNPEYPQGKEIVLDEELEDEDW